MIQWNEADEMIGRFSNILEKNATDTEGRPVYDLVIDSSKTTLEEDLERTLTFLLAEGIVKKITPDQNPEENSN